MKNQLITATIVLITICSCSSATKQEKQTDTEQETVVPDDKPVEIKAKSLHYTDFAYELICNGTINAMQKAELRFQSQEIIQKIFVKNGQRVRKGDKLAELDKFKLEIAYLQAKESLERANLDLQDVLIGQGYSLNDSASVPAEVMRIAQIRSNYEQSRNNYRIAGYNLDAATLYAPFDGVVANLTVKEYNQPCGEPFCTLINNNAPEVVFNILENELPFTRINDKVVVSPFSQPAYRVEGRISEINPLIDKNGMVRVKAVIDNKERKIHEGMNVKIHVQRLLSQQLVIPKSALVLRNNRKVVFTLHNYRANWVYVETEQENSDSYVVTSGLQAGDSIIYEGNMNLAHETKVSLQ